MIPATPETLTQEAKEIYHQQTLAVLSTQSVLLEGFPFGSTVGMGLGSKAQPLILLSGLAQHSKNLLANTKASLLLADWHSKDPQAGRRLTLMGHCRLAPAETGEEYFHRFPKHRDWLGLDFRFFEMEIERALYVGGFGKFLEIHPPSLW